MVEWTGFKISIMQKWILKIWEYIKNMYSRLVDKTKIVVPIAIQVVEGIKSVVDSPVDDIIAGILKVAIKGTKDDVIIDKIKITVEEWVPKVLLELQIVNSISNIENQNDQLKAILERIKMSSNETQNMIYHGLASIILEKLSDGKLSWSDSVAISEYYFKNIYKKQ